MLYQVSIKELEFKTIIGILDFERVQKQRIIVDLNFYYKLDKREFIDYAKVIKLIKKEFKNKKFYLIEDAVESILNSLFKKYPTIKRTFIRVTKPDIIKDAKVSVSASKYRKWQK
jgi:dihydroneopterin aldolase